MSKITWIVGDDELKFTEKDKGNLYRKTGNVVMYPHICIDKVLDMKEFAEKIKNKMQTHGYECKIYDESSYTRELNGSWNIVIGIKHIPENQEKEHQAMYLLSQQTFIDKTYGCPFYNKEYIYDLLHYSLHMNKELFELLEKCIKEINSEFKNITSFRTD